MNRDNVTIGAPFANPITGTVGSVVEIDADEFRVSYDIGGGSTGSAWYAFE